MNIKKYCKDTLDEGRDICNKHTLFVPTWSFSLWLKKDYIFDLKAIYILFDKKDPIGACLVLDDEFDVNVGIFIKPKYRNRGLGKKLLRFSARNNKGYELRYAMGIIGSLSFFDKAKKNLDNLRNIDYDESLD